LVAQCLAAGQRRGECGWAPLGEQVGRVEALGEAGVTGVEAVRGEEPEVAFGCDPPGEVGVGGHDRVAADRAELGGLLVGQRGTERSNAEVAAGACQRDGDGVHRALDDHGGGAVLEQSIVDAEQLGTLVEQRGVDGVEVLRSALVCLREFGAASADEPEDLAVVDHREHDPVAEAVDQPPGAGLAGDAGGQHLGVGDPVAAQLVDQVGPARWGLAGAEVLVAGEVDPEPFREVAATPGAVW
jgi:hypothetical protein